MTELDRKGTWWLYFSTGNCFGLPNTPLKHAHGKPWYVPETSTKKPKVDSNLEITIVRLDDIASVPIKSKVF